MDRFVSNTLRTLGIVLTSIFVICGCIVLLLLALCFGILANASGSGFTDPKTMNLAIAAVVGAVVLVVAGVSIVTMLSRGMVRATDEQAVGMQTVTAPSAVIEVRKAEAPAPPVTDEARLDRALAAYEARTAKRTEPKETDLNEAGLPPVPEPSPAAANQFPLAPAVAARPRAIDVRHLSPASRTAIQQLGFAIAAKIVSEVALGLVGWFGALGVPRAPFPLYRVGFIAWGLAAIAPLLVLLYALARRPGPRAFAYALVIPSLHLLFGIFGHSAYLAFILRVGQMAAPLLSIFPWLLDILILYLAWKAIRLTGIEPAPVRLITASVVIFVYTGMLPVLVVLLNYLQAARGDGLP